MSLLAFGAISLVILFGLFALAIAIFVLLKMTKK
ncbi:hypothetical protein SAMN05518871_10716 [Psychrobacillus sp. OK028]|nr:hypothetical protein SAMN05518871_10716 [Psychrobacillus sp. OK028]